MNYSYAETSVFVAVPLNMSSSNICKLYVSYPLTDAHFKMIIKNFRIGCSFHFLEKFVSMITLVSSLSLLLQLILMISIKTTNLMFFSRWSEQT